MNTFLSVNRMNILSVVLDQNGKLKQGANTRSWYEKNNVAHAYAQIFIETGFLSNAASLRERIYYIQNNLNSPVGCKYCKQEVRLKLGASLRFFKTCLSVPCMAKHKSSNAQRMWANKTPEELSQFCLNSSVKNKGKKLSLEQRKAMSERMKGVKQSKELVEKRMSARKNNGKEWHTESTRKKLSVSNQITHSSFEYKEKHKDTYALVAKKLSHIMKEKISKGEFTPPITNSWTKWSAYAVRNGSIKKFRSSWEAAFWLLNEDLEYEKVRIPYRYNGEIKIYIVDFNSKTTLYEIKPNSTKDNEKNLVKFKAADDWAHENGYEFKIVSDDWFVDNINLNVLATENSHLLIPMKKLLCTKK